MVRLAFGLLVFTLTGCSLFGGGPPPTGPKHSLAYFVLNLNDMPGSLTHTDLESVDRKWGIGTACHYPFEDKPRIVVCYAAFPPDTPVFLSALYGKKGSLFMGTTDYIYKLTPQNSPLTLKRSAKNPDVVNAGFYEFKVVDEGGWTSTAQFAMTKCRKCPSEKEIIAYLVKASEDGDHPELRENNFRTRLKAKQSKN